MIRFKHSRVALAATLLAVWWASVGSARSANVEPRTAMTRRDQMAREPRPAADPGHLRDRPRRLTRWNFIPTNMFPRKRVPIKEMNEAPRKLAHDLLKAGLSQRGYMTTTSIMELETILHEIENSGGRKGQNVRDPELYFFTVFGTPSPKSAWAWRIEGHHVSLHFAVANNTAVASSPSFFGSNPAEVRIDNPKKGFRALGPLEDAARISSRRSTMRSTSAVINNVAPNEDRHDHDREDRPLVSPSASPPGVEARTARPSDQAARGVRRRWPTTWAPSAKIKAAGFREVTFAWAGETEKGKKHYYRVQGPDVPRRCDQLAERRKPHPFRLARFRRRFRTGSLARARDALPH